MFDLDPVDVGAPPVATSSGGESKTKAARTESGLSLKVKVSSILDQSSDREVECWSREELNLLRSRYRSVEGEDPMKSEEVTDDQLSVLGALTRVGIAPYADFGVWKPFRTSSSPHISLTILAHGDAKKSMDLAASPRGKPAGACSELRPSCATSQRQLFWTGMQLGSGREWTDSRIPGTSVFWRTQGADRSCGRLSTVIKRNSTNPIQKFRHLYPAARGTASLKPRRMTEIFGKRNRKTKWQIFAMCAKWSTGLVAKTGPGHVDEELRSKIVGVLVSEGSALQ